MKTALALLFTLAIASCVRTDSPSVQPTDPDWIRLEIPAGREAYAIAGNIDKTLLVTTWTKAYYTNDQGKTWNLSRDFQGPVPGLYIRNDTTFSLQSFQTDQQGFAIKAAYAQYFTPDFGRTWDYTSKYYTSYSAYRALEDLSKPIGQIQSATGVSYSIRRNTTPVSSNSSAYYENPSQLLREAAGSQTVVQVPAKQKLINLYLDDQNRLYIGASGGTYEAEHNSFYCCTNDMPAVVYVSRKALP